MPEPEHFTDGRDCPCGTTTKPVELEDGDIGWLTVHREQPHATGASGSVTERAPVPKKRGRPCKTEPMRRQISMRLTDTDADRFEAEAARLGVTVQVLMRNCTSYVLDLTEIQRAQHEWAASQ